jgi:hypothetical protein
MIRLYKIKKKVLNINYELELLKGSKIHLIFYVLLLKEAARVVETSSKEIQPKHELDVYNVKRVLDSRVSSKG